MPAEAVNVDPTLFVPEIVGASEFVGGVGETK